MKPKPRSECDGCGVEFEGNRRFCTKWCEKTHECKAKGTTKFLKGTVATLFQKMIRAEYGAQPSGYTKAVKGAHVVAIHRHIGQCVCVTCGRVDSWSSGAGKMHTGHFVGSRTPSILLEEDNVAPQCSACNSYDSGQAARFRQWMESVRGIETIERLIRRKAESVSYTRDELVDRWFQYSSRLSEAKAKMESG